MKELQIFLNDFLNIITDFNTYSVVFRLILATVMGGLIGSERGRHGRAAGLRTHILVCVGASVTALTSLYLNNVLGNTGDLARLSAQVISGIGFLGAGTILIKNSTIITGLTTAAGMWTTAAIGISVGYGFYAGAAGATLVCLFSVTVLSRLERKHKAVSNIYIELTEIADTGKVIDIIRNTGDIMTTYDIIPPKSGFTGNIGINCILGKEYDFAALKEKVFSEASVVIMVNDMN